MRTCREKGCNGLAPFELDDGTVWAVCRAHLEELLPGAPAAIESTSREFRRRGGLFIDGLMVRDAERAHRPRLDRRERESDAPLPTLARRQQLAAEASPSGVGH